MRYLIVCVAGLVAACEFNVESAAPTAPTPTAPTSITITNTNTNTADRSDTAPAPAPSGSGGGSSSAVLPLPAYGEQVTRDVAAQNPTLLANSCQTATGEAAWGFLDLVIRTLRAQDQRWGYLCKDMACVTFAADIVAYRASTGDTGIWIVDVIGNHCPGPNTGDIPTVRWGVLPFELTRRWAPARKAGVFPMMLGGISE
jgi:hypothetical protein